MPVRTIPVAPGPRKLAGLEGAAGAEAVAAVRDRARELRRLRVVHVTTPPFAPRALDLLRSTVPLLADAGLDVRWLAVAGDDRADAAARAVGDALRGGEAGPQEDEQAWRIRGREAASEIPAGADVVVAHGAEALALLAGEDRAPAPRRVWWTEGDLSEGRVPADLLARADVVVAEREGWGPPGAAATVIAPALDPAAPRHLDLTPRATGNLARAVGVDLGRPMAVHLSEVDGWTMAERALDVVRAAREAGAEDLQLAITAAVPAGDPRAWRTLGELADHAAGVDDVVIAPNVGGTGDAEVNALQRLARVAIAEASGLAAAEAAWKGTPAATDGERIAALVADPGLAVQEARAARERVCEGGLVTRLLADQLELYARLASQLSTG